MHIQQFYDYVISPTLEFLDNYRRGIDSLAARRLLLGTALVESGLDSKSGPYYIRQVTNSGVGRARGVYQIEPVTHNDIVDRYLALPYNRPLNLAVSELVARHPRRTDQLISNLAYATAIARLKYWSIPERLPKADDDRGLGVYWVTWYNTTPSEEEIDRFVDRLRGWPKEG